MIIVLIVLAIFSFLLFAPTHIVIRYINDEIDFYIRLWYVVKIPLLKDKTDSEQGSEQEQKKDKKSRSSLSSSEKVEKISAGLRLAVDALQLFCKHFKMYRCKTHIVVAGEDPANVAVEFGMVNAAVYGIISYLNEKIRIGRKDICIGYDYQQDNTTFAVDFRFKVRLLIFVIILICRNGHDIIKLISKPEEIKAEVK